MRLGYDYHSGPILPIPRNDKNASWHSIVYLHGRLEPPEGAQFALGDLKCRLWARISHRRLGGPVCGSTILGFHSAVRRIQPERSRAPAYDRRICRRGRAGARQTNSGSCLHFRSASRSAARPAAVPGPQARADPLPSNVSARPAKEDAYRMAPAREDYLSNVQVMINRIARNSPEALDPSDTANLVWAVLGRPDDHGHGAKSLHNSIRRPICNGSRHSSNTRPSYAKIMRLPWRRQSKPSNPIRPNRTITLANCSHQTMAATISVLLMPAVR